MSILCWINNYSNAHDSHNKCKRLPFCKEIRGSLVFTQCKHPIQCHASVSRICLCICVHLSLLELLFSVRPYPGKRGHIVADTNVSPFARARNICCGHKFCVRDTKSVSNFVQKHVSATNVSQETSWATMCPQQCVLVYEGLKEFWSPHFEEEQNKLTKTSSIVHPATGSFKEHLFHMTHKSNWTTTHNYAQTKVVHKTGQKA